MIRILIVDDMEHVRQGLRTILELTGDIEVVGEAEDGLEAIEQAIHLKPDVVLMDLEMPKLDGLDATQHIKEAHPEIGIVMITIHNTEDLKERAVRKGVDAFIGKGTSTETLIETIKDVRDGTFISP
jgi:DNA-binding NarL/FixJ family response regulator